ncbi:hypothetical protein [Vibrio owensii]|uniref:hypothetical protein n=1 Tax=Vibrio owensii TaxID=696485 RepID=UPI0018F15B45|nr:hypothetical protein [Vibrio owensii]
MNSDQGRSYNFQVVNDLFNRVDSANIPFFVCAKIKEESGMQRSVISVESSKNLKPTGRGRERLPDGALYLVQRIYDGLGRVVVVAPLVAIEKLFLMQLLNYRNKQSGGLGEPDWVAIFSEIWKSVTPGIFSLQKDPDSDVDVVVSFKSLGGVACPLVEWDVKWGIKRCVEEMPLLILAQHIPDEDVDVAMMSTLVDEYHQYDSKELSEHLWSWWVEMYKEREVA